jgi:ketosteroid isomerase-like protein
MKYILSIAFTLLFFTSVVIAQTRTRAPAAPDAAEITKLLNEFMAAGATRNDYDSHDKFWADDLSYTRAAGVRITKAEIMRGRSASPPPADAPKAVFTAEDIRIQQYGKTAIVAFQLVAKITDGETTRASNYLNTATMLKRKGKWQVVGYQVTPVPVAEEEARAQVTSAEAAFWRAVLAGNAAALKKMTDEKFIWVHHNGNQDDAKKFVDDVAAGRLKYAKLTTDKITVTVADNTGIARGVSDRQRVDGTPFTTFYTLIFVNRNGAWKALSLHTSRNC